MTKEPLSSFSETWARVTPLALSNYNNIMLIWNNYSAYSGPFTLLYDVSSALLYKYIYMIKYILPHAYIRLQVTWFTSILQCRLNRVPTILLSQDSTFLSLKDFFLRQFCNWTMIKISEQKLQLIAKTSKINANENTSLQCGTKVITLHTYRQICIQQCQSIQNMQKWKLTDVLSKKIQNINILTLWMLPSLWCKPSRDIATYW
jgi:hypothetical protein